MVLKNVLSVVEDFVDVNVTAALIWKTMLIDEAHVCAAEVAEVLGFLKMVLQNLYLEVAERVATAGTERVTYEVSECAVGC